MESAMTEATVSSTAAASTGVADAAAAAIMIMIGETVALRIATVSEPVTAMEREGSRGREQTQLSGHDCRKGLK